MIGIYGIKNKINDKMYVGQSINTDRRFREHCCELNKGIHGNTHLQRSWNKYGSSNFEFVILVECDKSELSTMEEKHVLMHSDEMLYNIARNFTSWAGSKNPFYGKKHSEETRQKMSQAKDGKYKGADNPNYGNKQPASVRLKMVLNNSGTKLDRKSVLKIVDLLKKGMSHAEIAEQFGVSRTIVTRISNGTRWTNVTGGPIIPVIYKDGIRQFSELHRKKIGEKRKGQKHTEEIKAIISKKAFNRKRGS